MSYITLKPSQQTSVETPPSGFATIYINDVTGEGEVKFDNGDIKPFSTGNGVTRQETAKMVRGTTNDVTSLSPQENDGWIIGQSPTGILSGKSGKVVVWRNGNWEFDELGNNQLIQQFDEPTKTLKMFINSGVFPNNQIVEYKLESKIKGIELVSSYSDVADALNNSNIQITINSYDTIYIKHTHNGIERIYVWVGERSGKTYGDGSSNLATTNDFLELPNGAKMFSSTDFRIFDDVDSTKMVKVDVSNISSTTLRTLVIPDEDVDLSKVNTSIQKDGSIPFIAPQKGVDAVNLDELVTLSQLNSQGTNNYTHVQSISSTTWLITHNLGKYPSGVMVVDSAGSEVSGLVTMINTNEIKIEFNAPFTGKAYIS